LKGSEKTQGSHSKRKDEHKFDQSFQTKQGVYEARMMLDFTIAALGNM